MTFLHLLVLVLGAVAAIVLADVLGHRQMGPWPVGLIALVLAVLAGLSYSPWLAALSLGLGLGTGVVLVGSWTRSVLSRRHARREQARQSQSARQRQLEEAGELRR